MELSEKIKACRLQKEMTQSDLADQLNVSRKTISNWENKRSFPDIALLVQLSDLFSISLDDLLRDESLISNYIEKENDSKLNNKFLKVSYYLNCFFLIVCCVNLMTPVHIPFVSLLLAINLFVLVTHVSNFKKLFIKNKIQIIFSFLAINFFMAVMVFKLFFQESTKSYYRMGYITCSVGLVFLMSLSLILSLALHKIIFKPR